MIYGGVLGGGAHAITDHYLKQWLPDTPIEALGLSVKDIVLVYLGVHASKNWAKPAWQKQALEGMSVIAVYKTLYPKFIEPMISQWIGGSSGNPGNPGIPNPPPGARGNDQYLEMLR